MLTINENLNRKTMLSLISNRNNASTLLVMAIPSIITSIAHSTTTLHTRPQQQPTRNMRLSKSRLPLVLSVVFGGSVLVILVACIIVYILMKKGYIKAFSRSGWRVKGDEQSRMYPSTTTNGSSSPSER